MGTINILKTDNHTIRAPPLDRVALYRVNFSLLNTRRGWLSESGQGSSKVMLPTHSLAVRTSPQAPCTQDRGFHFKWLGLQHPSSIPLHLQCVWTTLGSHSHSCTEHPVSGQMSRDSSIIQSCRSVYLGFSRMACSCFLGWRHRVGLSSVLTPHWLHCVM